MSSVLKASIRGSLVKEGVTPGTRGRAANASWSIIDEEEGSEGIGGRIGVVSSVVKIKKVQRLITISKLRYVAKFSWNVQFSKHFLYFFFIKFVSLFLTPNYDFPFQELQNVFLLLLVSFLFLFSKLINNPKSSMRDLLTNRFDFDEGSIKGGAIGSWKNRTQRFGRRKGANQLRPGKTCCWRRHREENKEREGLLFQFQMKHKHQCESIHSIHFNANQQFYAEQQCLPGPVSVFRAAA